ncbi:MAG: hypothetical protein ACUVQ5_01780 [Candidatus Methanomethylicaceae archaeon]
MKARNITLMALLAAIYAVISLIPGFPVIGMPGTDIKLTRSLEMVYGITLGPALGPLSAFLGGFVGRAVTGGGSAIFFTPLAFVSSFMAAAMAKKEIIKMKGWLVSTALLGGIILVWYATPAGQSIPLYATPHIIGLGIILILRGRITELLHSGSRRRLFVGILLSGYPSTMAGQMLGNLIFLALFNPVPAFFMTVLPITIVERVIITLVAGIVGVPLLLAIKAFLGEYR